MAIDGRRLPPGGGPTRCRSACNARTASSRSRRRSARGSEQDAGFATSSPPPRRPNKGGRIEASSADFCRQESLRSATLRLERTIDRNMSRSAYSAEAAGANAPRFGNGAKPVPQAAFQLRGAGFERADVVGEPRRQLDDEAAVARDRGRARSPRRAATDRRARGSRRPAPPCRPLAASASRSRADARSRRRSRRPSDTRSGSPPRSRGPSPACRRRARPPGPRSAPGEALPASHPKKVAPGPR